MSKFNKLSDKELEFIAKSTAKKIDDFAVEYTKKFGAPKSLLRIHTMWYGRKKYTAKYQKLVAVKPALKEIVTPFTKKKVGEAMPDEGELLGKINNKLARIEELLKDSNHIAQKQLTLFESKMAKKQE
jgi:hypothetical protein